MHRTAEDPDARDLIAYWNGERLENCIQADPEAGWADVLNLDEFEPANEDFGGVGHWPVHRVYGEIRLVPKTSEG